MEVLGPDAVPAVAGLCARSLGPAAPAADELERALFAPERPAVVRGDPDRGVVATVVRRGTGALRLLVVDPLHRRRGLGTALLAAGEADLAGLPVVTAGGDAPDHLFPGVPLRETGLLTLLEASGYGHGGLALNLDVPGAPALGAPAPPAGADAAGAPGGGGVVAAGPDDAEELLGWVRRHHPRWEDETGRSLGRGTVVLSRDDEGITGFCAWGANRAAWLGPMAVDPARRGQGLGTPLVRAAVARMRAEGHARIEIAWVTTVAFYAKALGATAGDAYVVMSRPAPVGGPVGLAGGDR